jgi:hypothetical protein
MPRIEFQVELNGHVFRDAIDLPEDHKLSPADIEAIKAARVAAWSSASAPENAED